MTTEVELSKRERAAISDLKKLLSKWPKTLWLFNNGQMNVMRYKEDGSPAMNGDSFDSKYCVESISSIKSEGGDW